MSVSWHSETPPEQIRISAMGWVRVVLRGAVLATLVFGCLALLLLVRLFERPLCGVKRPVTPYITMFVCRNAFRILGMGFSTTGAQMREPGIVVANHSSWLDIFALNSKKRIYFVSKSEVAGWPGIGWRGRRVRCLLSETAPRPASKKRSLRSG